MVETKNHTESVDIGKDLQQNLKDIDKKIGEIMDHPEKKKDLVNDMESKLKGPDNKCLLDGLANKIKDNINNINPNDKEAVKKLNLELQFYGRMKYPEGINGKPVSIDGKGGPQTEKIKSDLQSEVKQSSPSKEQTEKVEINISRQNIQVENRINEHYGKEYNVKFNVNKEGIKVTDNISKQEYTYNNQNSIIENGKMNIGATIQDNIIPKILTDRKKYENV